MGHRWPALLAALSAVGCHEGTETEAPLAPPANECDAPNRSVGDRCVEPGVQDDGCAAGTLAMGEGNCQPAGVPPDLCAEGFVPDGNMGCEPVLPRAPCADGELAVPGERSCHPVMPCGAGKWGDIPIDGATIHVDASYTGGASDGTAARPWIAIGDALAGADEGALIAIAAGRYVEDVAVDKRVSLHGICPALVEIAGTSSGTAALTLPAASSGSEVRGIAVTGDGVLAIGTSLVVEHLWVHDALASGMHIEDVASIALSRSLIEDNYETGLVVSASQAVIDAVVVRETLPRASDDRIGRGVSIASGGTTHLRRSVVEGNHELGIRASGSSVELEGVVVRGTLPQAADQQWGWGIGVFPGPSGVPAEMVARGAFIEENHELGMYVSGSVATLDGVVVRGTLPRASDQHLGLGIVVEDAPPNGANVAIARSLVADNHDGGVFLAGAEATLEGALVRGTQPRASDQKFGRGVGIEVNNLSLRPPQALVKGSAIEQNHDVGVFVSGAQATLEGVVVRGTQPQASDQDGGIGIDIQRDPAGETSAIVTGSRIEDNHHIGVLAIAAQATLEGVVVRTTSPSAADQRFGRGVNLQADIAMGVPSVGLVRASLIEDNHDVGVFVGASQATLEGLLVRRTAARAADGLYGDGVAVTSIPSVIGDVDLLRGRVERSARAGVANFGAHVLLDANELSCNAIDLDGESQARLPFIFDDAGGNLCGCPEPNGACIAQSSGLAPPEGPD